MYYTIYQVTHKPTGKFYIGKHQTSDPHDDYMGSGHLIRKAIKKYGTKQFEKTVLHTFPTREEMNSKERELVTPEFCNRRDTYNLCEGGKGGWEYVNRIGRNIYGENGSNFAKISSVGAKALAEKRKDPEWSARLNQNVSVGLKKKFGRDGHHWEGRTHTVSARNKMKAKAASIDRSGNKNPNFGKRWMNDGAQSKPVTANEQSILINAGWQFGRL